MSVFDALITSLVLHYSHHSDWNTLQPYRISKTFYQSFTSEEFAREYVRNVFSLNDRQTLKLHEMIQYANQFFRSLEESSPSNEEKHSLKTVGMPKKKKRKQNFCSQQTYTCWSILKTFVKLYNTDRVKQMNHFMTDYSSMAKKWPRTNICLQLDLTTDKATNCLEKMQDLLHREQQQVELMTRMQDFFTNPQTICYDENIEVSSELVNKLFGKLKGVFLTNFENRANERMFLEYVVFCDCGFPLTIFTESSKKVDTYRRSVRGSELVSINSKTLFTNNKYYDERGELETEFSTTYDLKLLDFVKTVLLDTSEMSPEDHQVFESSSTIGFKYGIILLLSSFINVGILLPIEIDFPEEGNLQQFPYCLAPQMDELMDDFIDDSEVNNEERKSWQYF
nr:unnamed protein product [Naegleria fowleri]